jgi:hypothetical protein
LQAERRRSNYPAPDKILEKNIRKATNLPLQISFTWKYLNLVEEPFARDLCGGQNFCSAVRIETN